jgi:nickel-dependent lactate racemase
MDRFDFVKKLGEDTLSRFPVYNHDPFDNCVYVGVTSRGTKVFINAEVMKCDLKIGIGSIVPHIMTGFGGGSKIVLPGVAALETIQALHSPTKSTEQQGLKETLTGMGVIENNPRRLDIDEAAALAHLDFIIDAIVNMWGETVAIFAGAPKEAYTAGLNEAKAHYLTPAAKDKDIVIANTFAKVSETVCGLLPTLPAVSQRGGDVVLIGNAPEGQVTHYLTGPFGETIGGRLRLQIKVPPNVNRLIVFNEYPEIASKGYFEETDRVLFMHRWDDVLRVLEESPRPKAHVALYPNADIQYCA